jgi:amidase
MECLNVRAKVMRAWNETANEQGDLMDAYIAPVVPATAPLHGDYCKVRYFAYTATVNLLDYTACTFPVGFVDPELDGPDSEYLLQDAGGNALPEPSCDRDRIIRERYSTRSGAELYRGLPMSLQLVGRKYEEEKVLGILDRINEAMGQDGVIET